MIQDCSVILSNIERLEALSKTGLFGTKPEDAFTRLNYMATKLLKAPISIFSLIGEKSQFFKSAAGFTITEENNQVPIDTSVCMYSLQGKPLSITDTKNHPMFSTNPAVLSLDIVGYLGIPVITKEGHPIGAVCVIDHVQREWTKEEISLLEDITAAFISEIELRKAMQLVEEESRLREEFIAIASHELKTPLSTLLIQSQLVQRKLSKGTLTLEDNTKFLVQLEKQTKRLEMMIDDMSDASRLASGKLSLYLEQVNLNSLIEDLVGGMTGSLINSNNEIRCNFQSQVKGSWDPSRIEQIFTNLISNAAKYAPGCPIDISLEQKNNMAIITFTDHGPGISNEQKERLFKKYGKVGGSSHVKGIGLGLYISRQIALEHGGSLELKDDTSKGATFIVELPIK